MMIKKCLTGVCIIVLIVLAAVSANAQLIDNGNGTISDNVTGLMWQKATAPGSYTWAQALSYCENLPLGGHSDWRLPTIKELDSIVDLSRYNPAINTDYFPDTIVSHHYWSSTTHAYNTSNAWGMYLNYGFLYNYYKYNYSYVRAVRGGQSGSSGSLAIAQTPMSAPPGTTFTQWGTGFTPNSTATLHFRKPDGTGYPTQQQAIDASGHFEITYTAPYDKPAGNYTWWAVDGPSEQSSNAVTYAIEGVAGGLHHFAFGVIPDQTVGVSFSASVEAVDYAGNRVTSFSGYVSLNHNGPGTVSTGHVYLNNGYGTFSAQFTQPNANCVINAAAAGIYGQSNAFAVNGGSSAKGTISGFVTGSDETVEVILSRTPYGLEVSRVTALADGQYLFAGVSAGLYYIWAVDSDENSSVSQSVKLEAGQPARVPDLKIHSKKRPVIFVPGIMGSDKKWNPSIYPKLPQKQPADQDDLQLHDPGGFVHQNPLAVGWTNLEWMLEGNYAVFKCPYDWRVNLMSSEDTYKKYLMPIIAKAKEKTGWEKVDIVAHSMGGLLVRSYIQSDDYNNDIDKFVMVGTPNKGSLNVYPMWEGGDAMLSDENAGSLIYLYSNVADNLYNELYRGKHLYTFFKVVDSGIDTFIPKKMNISNKKARSFFWDYCQSAWNLMPTFDDCLKKDGDFKNIEKLRNKWLIGLNNDSGVSLMKAGGPVQTRIFASNSEDTLSWLDVKDSTMDGLYEDGMNEKSPHKEENGDGTVPYESAQLEGVNSMAGSYGGHGSLIKSFALDIEYFLNDGRTLAAAKSVRETKEEPVYTSSLGVSVSGPPSVLLTDPSGLKCGIDQTTGEVFEEIAGSKTLGQSGDAMATIPDPANGAFTVKLTGSETGTASISISYMTETDSEEQQFILNFSGAPVTFTFTLDSSGSPKIIVDGIPAAPIGLSGAAYPSGETQLTRLNWQASDDPSITGYRIYARNENDSDFTLLAEVPASQTQYDTSDPWNDPARTYAISAVDSEGHEGFLSDFVENITHLLADFETPAVTGETPLVAQFTDTSTGTPTAWQWDFGDGETSTEQNPSHTYNEPGTFTVSLTVTDAEDNQDIEIKSDLVTVAQGDFIVTSIADSFPGSDFIPGTLRYAVAQATANGTAETDTIRFADGLGGMTIQLYWFLDIPGNLVIDGTGAPVIDGSFLFFPGPGMMVNNAAKTEISGLTFSDFSLPVYITGGSDLKLIDNTVSNGWFYIAPSGAASSVQGMEITGNHFDGELGGGILLFPGNGAAVEDVLIADNTLTQNNYIGLQTSEAENENNDCRISNIGIRNNHTQNEIYAYIGSGSNNRINGITIEDNLIEYSAENTGGYGVGLINKAEALYNFIDAVVRRNIITGMKITGISVSGDVIVSITNNICNGNSIGILLYRGCLVHAANNLMVRNIHGIEIDQNTYTELVSNMIVDNCISGVASFSGLPLTGQALEYNNVWNNGTDYIGISAGESDISIDPEFEDAGVGDWHLAADSSCIDAGHPNSIYNDGSAGQGETRSDIGLYGGPDSKEFADGTPAANYIEGGAPEYYLTSIKPSENIREAFSGEFDLDTQYRVRADAASYSCDTSAKVISPLGTQIILNDDGNNGDRYAYDLMYGGAVQYSETPELGDWHFEVTAGAQPYTGTVTLGENTLEPPEFMQPIDGAVNTGTTPEIMWQMPESSAAPEGFEVSIYKGKPETFNSKYAIFYTYIDNPDADRFQIPAGVLEPGTIYYVVISAQIEENNVYYLASEIARFNTTVITGDLNTDGDVDLEDAIHALKAMAGMDTADVHGEAEISGDGKVGIEEVVYILQKAAGLR